MASLSRTIRVRFDGDAKGIGGAVGSGIRDLSKFAKQIKKTAKDTGDDSGFGFTGSFGDAVKTGFKKSVPGFLSEFGSTFTAGFKGIVSSPVIGPIIVAALASVAAIVAPAAATLIGGAIVAGVGAGLVGMGFILLAQNEKVKKQFSQTFGEVKKILTDAAKPLLPVLTVVRSVIKGLAKEFGPVLKAGFSLAAGPLKGFIRDLGKGFANLKPAIKPIMEAFSNILRSIGPQLPGIFKSVGTSVGDLARVVGDNSDLFAALFIAIVKGVEFAIEAIGWLTKAFRSIINVTFPVAKAFLSWADTILGAIQDVVNVIAEIPGPFQASFRKISNSIGDGRRNLQNWGRELDKAPKVLKLRGDIRDLDTKLASARAQLKDKNLTKERRAKLNADIRELLRKKREAQNAINSLQGKTVFIKTEYQSSLSRAALRAASGARATGGSVAAGRSYLVGERGPELLQMGSRNGNIIPNNKLGDGSGDVQVSVFIGDQELKGIIRTEVSESNRGLKRRALAA